MKNNIRGLSDRMTLAYVLNIDGKDCIAFSSREELDTAIENFKQSYISDDTISAELIQQLSVEYKNAPITMLCNVDKAQQYFTEMHLVDTVYTATANTTISDIANKLGISMATIKELNPGIDNNIEKGQSLAVKEYKSLLQIKTVTQSTSEQAIAYNKEIIEDSTLYKGEEKIVTKGKEGRKLVDAEVVAVNGVVQNTTVLSELLLSEPVTQVAKVGTKTRPTYIGTAKFLFPTSGTITSRYGSRWGRNHDGLDIANSTGTAIKASDNGIVTFAGTKNGYGLMVIINHQNGYETYYGHCSKLAVKTGAKVQKGDIIAYMGNTGNSTGPHLHFEIRKNGIAQNPSKFLNK